IRLPDTAFKKNANTEVTTDILMLRRLGPGERRSGPPWIETGCRSQGEAIRINEYFLARPHMMLGEMQLTGRMYRNNEPTLVSDGRDLAFSLAEAVRSLPEGVYQVQKQTV